MHHFATIIIDFDSTLVQVESLEDLAAIALADAPNHQERIETITELTNQAMAGTLPFDEAFLEANREHLSELVQGIERQMHPSLSYGATTLIPVSTLSGGCIILS